MCSISCERYDLTATVDSDTVGKLQIDFILLNLTDYKKRVAELTEAVTTDFTVDTERVFAMYNSELYAIAK